MKITLYNLFHNKQINIIPKKIDDIFIYVSKNQKRRVQKKLCGISNCYCKTVSYTSIQADTLFVIDKPHTKG